jgi:general secretion pathway protein G
MRQALAFAVLMTFATIAAATQYEVEVAKVQIDGLTVATQLLQRDIGRAPLPSEWPEILVAAPEELDRWKGPYIPRLRVNDPWGHPYVLESCPLRAAQCRIYSFGVNGIDERGANDDVSTWADCDRELYFPNQKRDRVIALAASVLILWGAIYAVIRLYRYIRKWTMSPNNALEQTRDG